MSFLVTLVQVFSSLLTIISAVGLFGIPEKFQEFGIKVSQLQIAFALSLGLAILSLVFGRKIRPPDIGGDKKTQIQMGGSRNKQDMR